MARLVAALLLVLDPAVGFRTRHHRANSLTTFSGRPAQATGDVGQIAAFYTFGGPAVASPGLQYPMGSSPCFPGLRVVAARKANSVLYQQVDPIPLLAGVFGYEHTAIQAAKIFINDNASDIKWANCGESWPEPQTQIIDPLLHIRSLVYVNEALKFPNLGDVVLGVIRIALNIANMKDQQEAADTIRPHGWNLVDTASVDDPIWLLSDSISHLMQEPVTKSCMLTFRGSRSVEDWYYNVQIPKTHFCGFVDVDEECQDNATCATRRTRGSFVHKGFRDHLRQLVASEDWQTKIRPHLSGCSEVIAVGHSLGGAAAMLFGACAAMDLKSGEYGYEDYEQIGWTVGEPRLLPAWGGASA